MILKNKVILSSVSLAVAFAFGRYSVQNSSVKAVEDTTTHTDTSVDRDKHKETTTVTEKEPDGTTKTTTKIVEDTTTKKKVDSDVKTHIDEAVTPPKTNTVNISALVGMDWNEYKPVYGASVSKQLLGPISIGAFGLTNGTLGVSIGVTF